MEIPPQQISTDFGSQPTNAGDNQEEESLSSADVTGATTSNAGDDIDTENESVVGNSSGFDEKTSSSGSSGIATSEQEGINALQQHMDQYETSSDENEDYNTDEGDDAENSSSEHYFDTDETDNEEEGEPEECSAKVAQKHKNDESIRNQPKNVGMDGSSNRTDRSQNVINEAAYTRWVDLYWKQLNLVQDYVNLYKFSQK